MSFFDNTCKPTGLGGKLMVAMMNLGHRSLADWGLRYLALAPDAGVLDCGCGGGANIKKLLKKCPGALSKGLTTLPSVWKRHEKGMTICSIRSAIHKALRRCWFRSWSKTASTRLYTSGRMRFAFITFSNSEIQNLNIVRQHICV